MRYLNQPYFRRICDLRDGLSIGHQEHVSSEEITGWISERMSEALKLVSLITGLIAGLSNSWGEPGKQGDLDEIHHMCCLIRDFLKQVVEYEERLYSTTVPKSFEKLLALLKNLLGSQAEKLKEIPILLDNVVAMIDEEHEGTVDNPKIIQGKIVFDLPNGWTKKFNRELARQEIPLSYGESDGAWNVMTILAVVFLAWFIYIIA